MPSAVSIVLRMIADLIGWVALGLRSRRSLQAEVLFLRRQLGLYVERGVRPRRADAGRRLSLALLSQWFEWRSALVVVQPETLIRCAERDSGSSGDGNPVLGGRRFRRSYGN
jgi:hypothetical protein